MVPEEALTREQIRQIDRLAIEEYGMPGILLMENAGRNAAHVILHEVLPPPNAATVAIVSGSGNNAGDGFVIARHLVNAGVTTEVFLAADPAKLVGDAAVNHRIAERMRIPMSDIHSAEQLAAARLRWKAFDVIVDAILGTGFRGQVRAPLDAVIRAVNATHADPLASGPPLASGSRRRPMVVAIDLPSGLDADTAQPSNATIEADLTITMAARKTGFDYPQSETYTGRVAVVDIGAPRPLIEAILTKTP